jgi:hypothetical protein
MRELKYEVEIKASTIDEALSEFYSKDFFNAKLAIDSEPIDELVCVEEHKELAVSSLH